MKCLVFALFLFALLIKFFSDPLVRCVSFPAISRPCYGSDISSPLRPLFLQPLLFHSNQSFFTSVFRAFGHWNSLPCPTKFSSFPLPPTFSSVSSSPSPFFFTAGKADSFFPLPPLILPDPPVPLLWKCPIPPPTPGRPIFFCQNFLF